MLSPLILILIFALCFILSFMCSFWLIKYSSKKNIFLDKDSILKPQKMHYGDIPRAGGVGIILALLLGLAIFMFIKKDWEVLLFIPPMLLIFASGILEDFANSISPKKRLILQTLGSLIMVLSYKYIITDIGFNMPIPLGIIFSVFCIVGIINAINIIDGFNGLAGGYAVLVFLSIGIVSYIVDKELIVYMCIISIGSILGFMVLNFPKGKIFLGDGGAYLIGFILACLLIMLTQNRIGQNVDINTIKLIFGYVESSIANTIDSTNIKVSAYFGLCVMIYPVFEVIFSVWRKKFVRNMSAMEPDGVHFHMLIYKRATRSNYKTSILIWLFNLPFLIGAVIFFDNTLILLILIVIFIALYLSIYFKIVNFGIHQNFRF